MSEPRAKTAEEVRHAVMWHIASLAYYWGTLPGKTPLEACNGLAFSLLTMFDGDTGLPAMDIALSPHPDDKEFHRSQGDNWYEPGQVINNDGPLHEIWHSKYERG